MIGLGENFDIILDQVEKVRRKETLYTVFKFAQGRSTKYEIKATTEHPNKNDKFVIRSEEEMVKNFEEFKKQVSPTECAYALFDFEIVLSDGSPRSTLFLITVAPDNCPIKDKFLYAAHTQEMAERIGVAVVRIQINKVDELTYEFLKHKCRK
ncbi:cofilin [Nematocida sp. AWRm77]|nr:cofilin [Nematocida sp. AWRm77]